MAHLWQLEELEDKDVMETSVVLEKDGSIRAGTTNGPLPMSSEGTWSFDGKEFSMVRGSGRKEKSRVMVYAEIFIARKMFFLQMLALYQL